LASLRAHILCNTESIERLDIQNQGQSRAGGNVSLKQTKGGIERFLWPLHSRDVEKEHKLPSTQLSKCHHFSFLDSQSSEDGRDDNIGGPFLLCTAEDLRWILPYQYMYRAGVEMGDLNIPISAIRGQPTKQKVQIE
jgi:hypothetical protein